MGADGWRRRAQRCLSEPRARAGPDRPGGVRGAPPGGTMGITIAYTGKLSDAALVPELVSDLTAKAKDAGWLCKTMKELLAEGRVKCPGLEGISLYPHRECEPVHFHFDPEGTFINHTYHALLNDSK